MKKGWIVGDEAANNREAASILNEVVLVVSILVMTTVVCHRQLSGSGRKHEGFSNESG